MVDITFQFEAFSFNGICKTVALPLCPLMGKDEGIEPECYSRNVDLGGNLIFQPGMCMHPTVTRPLHLCWACCTNAGVLVRHFCSHLGDWCSRHYHDSHHDLSRSMQIHSRRYERNRKEFPLKHIDNMMMQRLLRSQGDCHVLLPLHAQRFPRAVAYHRHNTNIQHSIHGKSNQAALFLSML